MLLEDFLGHDLNKQSATILRKSLFPQNRLDASARQNLYWMLAPYERPS
jgi:hypothetical protein